MKLRLRLRLKFYPSIEPRLNRTLRLFAAGISVSILAVFVIFIYLNISHEKKSYATSPGANLNQARNGTDALPTSPVNWVNGNLGGSQAHYVEGMSAPFQCVMDFLTPGTQVTITIGYDITNSSKHAFDYLTYYNRIMPHSFALHNTPETIDPLIGTGLGAGTPFTTYTIPAPSSAGSPTVGQPTNSYNALTVSDRKMTLFNGTIDTIYYAVQGDLNASSSETQVVVKYTPVGTTAVLAWGGHLGNRNDWGYTSGSANSAGGISGSPFHMRLISWSYGSLGSQDRSLSGATVGGPSSGSLPVTLVSFTAAVVPGGIKLNWSTASEINNDYFTLEHSAEGIHYYGLDNIDGAGNSTGARNYSYTDENPFSGTNYYRLTQTDFDGKQKVFDGISINRDGEPLALSIVNIYPNPFTEDFSITYNSEKRATTQIEIFNADGRLIYTQPLDSKAGINRFDYNKKVNLLRGIYFVSFVQDKTKTEAKRIVKY